MHPLEAEEPEQEEEQLAVHVPVQPLIASSMLLSLPQELASGIIEIPAKTGKVNFTDVLKNSLRFIMSFVFISLSLYSYQL